MKKLTNGVILVLCLLICLPTLVFAKDNLEKPTHLNISIQKNKNQEYSHFLLSWINPKSIRNKLNKNIPIEVEIDLKNNGDPWHSASNKPLVVMPLEDAEKSMVKLDENSFATAKEFNVFLSNYSFRVRYKIGNDRSEFSSFVSVGLRPNLKNVSGWSQSSVNKANKLGLIPNSVKDDLKAPISRDEFAHILTLAYEKKAGKVAQLSKTGFIDSNKSYILKAKGLGLIEGNGNNLFNPNGQISREEMAVMVAKLVNILGEESWGKSIQFKDTNEISTWARTSVDQVASLGHIKGYKGNFMPKKTSSREEAIIVVNSLLNIK